MAGLFDQGWTPDNSQRTADTVSGILSGKYTGQGTSGGGFGDLGGWGAGAWTQFTSGQTLRDLGHSATHLSDWNPVSLPKMPDPKAPPVPPSLAETNRAGLSFSLSREQQMAATSTILTGGSGLLDEPTTASRVLLGS